MAEYSAIIKGMAACIARGYREVEVFSDSQLCIRQINGEYKVRKARLKPLCDEVKRLRKAFVKVEFMWVARENEWTARCDGIARAIIEEKIGRM